MLPSIKNDKIIKIAKPNKPVKALVRLISKYLNCLEKTCAKAKANAIRLAKNNPHFNLRKCIRSKCRNKYKSGNK